MRLHRLALAFFALWVAVGLVVLHGSVHTLVTALGRTDDPARLHLALLAGIEAVAALLFLLRRSMRLGAAALLVTFGIAIVAHAARGEFAAPLVVYAVAVLLVMVHGPASLPSLWQLDARADLLTRVGRLRPETPALWGRMTCPQMLAHLNDAVRMATGELPTAPRTGPMRRFPLKQLVVYLMPIPRGVPTARELIARIDRAEFAQEAAAFPMQLERFADRPADTSMPAHPAFGPLSRRAWGVLAYRHCDHHLRQFGV